LRVSIKRQKFYFDSGKRAGKTIKKAKMSEKISG
jgi:hypothetical protein